MKLNFYGHSLHHFASQWKTLLNYNVVKLEWIGYALYRIIDTLASFYV